MLSDAAAVLSNASNTGMGSPHSQAWSQAMQLEKRLKGEARKRSFWDPEVGGVREGAWGGDVGRMGSEGGRMGSGGWAHGEGLRGMAHEARKYSSWGDMVHMGGGVGRMSE